MDSSCDQIVQSRMKIRDEGRSRRKSAMTVVQRITETRHNVLTDRWKGKKWLYGNVHVEFPGLQ